MDKFIRKLLTEWRKLGLPFEEETFLIAVSGGADSTALTLALKDLKERNKLKLNFTVAHFNHGIRAESDDDEDFVRELASVCGFDFVSKKVDFSKVKSDLEQKAREERYKFLREIAEKKKAFGILTAHTMNDQAETLLMNLIRGSGMKGLSAMKTIRQISGQETVLLVRPFLKWAKRDETISFCLRKNFSFRVDSMNEDMRYTRARIRHELIPLLETFNPNIVEILSKTAQFISEEDEALENLVSEFDDEKMKVAELKKMASPLRRRILMNWIKNKRGNLRGISSVHIEAVEKLILSEKSGRFVELPKGCLVRKSQGKLCFEMFEKSQHGN